MKPLDKELWNYLGLGLGTLSLILQVTQPRGPEVSQADRDKALMSLATQGIESARGTNICISWDCKGSVPETQPSQETQQVFYKVEPGTKYVDPQGQELPTFRGQDGNTYLSISLRR